MYATLIRPFFFLFNAERAHYLALNLLSLVLKIPGGKAHCRYWYQPRKAEKVNAFGLQFPNAIGLAAGFDKNAAYIAAMAHLGFGHIEIGTVTPRPQPGNPIPRLFRLPKDKALINRMGFNNDGVDAVIKNLRHPSVQKVRNQMGVIVGGNIGKNKTTPNATAWEDYVICFKKLFDYVDYFVVNVSSPNTPGLRELQEKEPLLHLLNKLQDNNRKQPQPKPILLKIAPDLSPRELDDVAEVAVTAGLAGIIVSNTTLDRKQLKTAVKDIEAIGAGGLSGRPLMPRSTDVLRYMRKRLPESIDIIGVGGVMHADDVLAKKEAGAALVQVYTGFIYEGPAFVKKLLS